MKVRYVLNDIAFEWDSRKAEFNLNKHDITFKVACEAFFDPFVQYLEEETIAGELRETIIGLTVGWQLLYVVYVRREDTIRISFSQIDYKHRKKSV